LRLLDGIVDIYMPDFKVWSAARAARYLTAEDYPDVARAALREMHRQVGALRIDESGLAWRGVLVRHLVMPGGAEDAARIFEFLADELSRDTYVNVMAQYTPEHRAAEFPEIAQAASLAELQTAHSAFLTAGLHRLDNHRPRFVPVV
jgi:putative pyruvate formate lyase activating enzyme